MIAALRAYLQGDGAMLLPDGRPGDLRILKISGAPTISAPVKLLVFCADEVQPRLVCHVARHPCGDDRLQQQWSVRREILAQLPDRLQRTVPTPLALVRLDGVLVLIETGLPGRTLHGPWKQHFEWRRFRVTRELGLASSWLDAFQRATLHARRPWERDDEDAYVSQFFSRTGRWLHHGVGREIEPKLRRRLLPLRGVEVPWAAQHGDFWHGNVLDGPAGVCVVDWEVARCSGPAFVDPLTFGFQYLFWRPGKSGRRPEHLTGPIPAWLHHAIYRFLLASAAPFASDAAQLDAAFIVSLLARCQLGGYEEGPPIALRVLLAALTAPVSLDWLRG